MKHVIILLLLALSVTAFSQNRFTSKDFSINGFRSPSIGLEYRYHQVSIHAGYYLTAFEAGETTTFIKTGLTYWFLPFGKKPIPSSLFTGISYLRGLSKEYEDKNALGIEVGVRIMIWKGLNLRISGITVTAKDESLKINPAGGVSYSFMF
ncbi:MAG: hypothetical protein ABI761_12905 [Saprospiraceae bacterium]